MLKSVQFQKLVNRVGTAVNDDMGSAILLKKFKIGCFVCSLKSNIFAVGKYDTRRREAFGTTHAGLSQILRKHRNAVQIEQNLFKAEVAQAAAALFSK